MKEKEKHTINYMHNAQKHISFLQSENTNQKWSPAMFPAITLGLMHLLVKHVQSDGRQARPSKVASLGMFLSQNGKTGIEQFYFQCSVYIYIYEGK